MVSQLGITWVIDLKINTTLYSVYRASKYINYDKSKLKMGQLLRTASSHFSEQIIPQLGISVK